MKSKKATKKHSQGKAKENTLIALLMNKHNKQDNQKEKKEETAYVLETILSGSDEELQSVLEEWSDTEGVQNMVKGWGPSNSTILFKRLLSLVELSNHNWAFPWILAILNLNMQLPVQSIGQLNASLANESTLPLIDVLRLEGKLQLFDV